MTWYPSRGWGVHMQRPWDSFRPSFHEPVVYPPVFAGSAVLRLQRHTARVVAVSVWILPTRSASSFLNCEYLESRSHEPSALDKNMASTGVDVLLEQGPKEEAAHSYVVKSEVQAPMPYTRSEDSIKPVHDYTHRNLKPRHIQLIGIGG